MTRTKAWAWAVISASSPWESDTVEVNPTAGHVALVRNQEDRPDSDRRSTMSAEFSPWLASVPPSRWRTDFP